MKVNLVNQGVTYGILLGLIELVLMYGGWAFGINIFVTIQFWSAFIPYLILILIFVGLQIRKNNDGYLSFKEAIKFIFLSYAVTALIVAIGTYILYNIIDKDLSNKSFQVALQKTQEMMSKMGANEEQTNKAIADAKSKQTETNLSTIFLGLGLQLIWAFVKALLIALVIKKEKPVFNNDQLL